MKIITSSAEKSKVKNTKKKTETSRKPAADKFEDVQRLVYLLQVHQVELEHQNEELRLAHEELEASRNKYVNLFDFSPIPYFTLDVDGTIKKLNLSASKMLGIDRNKLIGKNFITYIHLDERDVFQQFIKSVFETSTKQSREIKVVNKDKTVFNVQLEGLQIDYVLESEVRCQIAVIDLTEYKRIENSLKKSNEELQMLNATKDKFFSIVAHDLRSPFQSLLSFSEMLATEIETLSQEEIVLFSKGLNEDMRNLYSLLDNLLHWSLIQRDIFEHDPVNLKLYDVVDRILRIANQNAVKKNIKVNNEINPTLSVYADAEMLRLVVQNLVSNAIKFTPPDGNVIISAIEKKSFIEVTVSDNGVGIDNEKTVNMFDFNTMFSTNGTDGEQGTGLGLPLCKEFVERNEGKIRVESEPGKGSKFIFTLLRSLS